MQLGQTIQKIRKENHLTQEEFAEIFHVTRQTVSNWENEKSYPDLLTLVAISDNFHISLDKMLKEDIKMTEKLNKEIHWAKHMRMIFAVVLGIIVVTATIWFLVWNHYKTVTEDKFQKGLAKYEYSIDENCSKGGYYVIPYDKDTCFTLPNQVMPDYFDFSTDFHAKDVDCSAKLNGETISICWSLYEGGGAPDYDALVIRNDDGLDRKLKSAEREQLSDILDYGFKLYNTVYRLL